MSDLQALWCLCTVKRTVYQVIKKVTQESLNTQDEISLEDYATLRVLAFFSESKQEGCLESGQNTAKWKLLRLLEQKHAPTDIL